MENNFYTIELTEEEITEISIALQERIETLSERLTQVQTIRGKQLIREMLRQCASAQNQITNLYQ